MPKTSALTEYDPEAPQGAAKARKRGAPSPTAAEAAEARGPALAIERGSIPFRPLLIGVGVGAAVTATLFVVRGQRQRQNAFLTISPPSLSGALMKVTLYRLARVLARRAVRNLANEALRKVVRALPR